MEKNHLKRGYWCPNECGKRVYVKSAGMHKKNYVCTKCGAIYKKKEIEC